MPSRYNRNTTASELVGDLQVSIGGKVILVTGASPNGLGARYLEAVARSPLPPQELILGVRNKIKGEEEAKRLQDINPRIHTRVVELDLASFESVRQAAREINALDGSLDVIVNNAGVMAVPYAKTEDGNEMQLQANHLGHFLFTNLVLEKLLASRLGVEMVNRRNKWTAYGQSKTAQLLFSEELARRLGNKGLQSYSVHPGVNAGTSLADHIPNEEQEALWASLTKADKLLGNQEAWDGLQMLEPDQGTATQVLASFSPDLKDHNGEFLVWCQPVPKDDIHPWAIGERECRKAWALSEKLVGQTFDY